MKQRAPAWQYRLNLRASILSLKLAPAGRKQKSPHRGEGLTAALSGGYLRHATEEDMVRNLVDQNLVISPYLVNRQADWLLPGSADVDRTGCVAVELIALPAELTLSPSPKPWCVQHRGLPVVPGEVRLLGRMMSCKPTPALAGG